MNDLATLLLSLMLAHGSAGKSVFSAEPIPACGKSGAAPTCELRPVCAEPTPLCAAPRWSDVRNAWVRAETREAAASRLGVAAVALADAATFLTRCTVDGVPVERCKPVTWPEGTVDFAKATLTVAVWESGLREDIMGGHPPKGRGAAGEACVMQVMPNVIRSVAPWLPAYELAKTKDEQLALMLVGTDGASLRRCFETGGRLLARMRKVAQHECKQRWSYSLWARYGTAGRCDTVGIFDDFAAKREKTYLNFRKKTSPQWPEWFTPELRVALAGGAGGAS
ncbi:MAG TPA: hypothetical protein VJN18_32400 [Polyangiaceae bacterium]|nr:hypothetical protein [Polyangiaceae bacterium]